MMPATTDATRTIFPEDETECMTTPTPTKISSRPRQSIPKKTVEVIRAQFLPAWLALAIQIHRLTPMIAPGMPDALEPLRMIRSKIRPRTSSPAPAYMSMTARWIDCGGPVGMGACQPWGAGVCQPDGSGEGPPGYCCPPSAAYGGR